MNTPTDVSIGLSLPLSSVNYILAIAAERPFKESHALIQLVQQQAQACLDAPQAPVAAENLAA